MPKIPKSLKRLAARKMAAADINCDNLSSRQGRKMSFSWSEGDLVEIRKTVIDRYGSYEKFPAGMMALVLTEPYDLDGTPYVDVLINSTVVKNAKATDFIKCNNGE